MLAWTDIKNRYRRSVLGPLWISLSMGITIASIGIIFSTIFDSNIEIYLPFLALGLVVWGFISSSINEGCQAFIDASAIIKQISMPMFVHIQRVIFRNLIVLAHNILILPIIYFYVNKSLNLNCFIIFPALLIVTFFLTWIVFLLAMICARFRDVPQIVHSIVHIFFYITPIIWVKKNLPLNMELFVYHLNPFYHMLSLIRDPLLGNLPSMESWLYLLSMNIFGWVLTLYIYKINRNKLVYWL